MNELLSTYLMNYYKNTRAKGVKLDNQGFFAIEQIAATAGIALVGIFLPPPFRKNRGLSVELLRRPWLNWGINRAFKSSVRP